MCGIAGIWHRDGRAPNVDALLRMTRALIHRGPDEEGYHLEPGIALGHRRLSIIDLSNGQQPLCNEDGTVWVAFNGEIFNYVELRADLEKCGHSFKTNSDTETLVHLYEEKGLSFVDDLNGQFAIALWDRPRRRLLLARDRVGIRPLFHATLADGSVLFGSEIKALFAHGELNPEVDPIALGQISTLWVTIPPRTAFRGVEELPPGSLMVLEKHRRTEHRYWKYEFPAEDEYEDRPFSYWRGQVREKIHDAVRLQLRSDVPVGAYLSGGLDSSILTSLVKGFHDNDLKTFSVAFSDARFDEREFQQQMVNHLGTDHRQIEVSGADIGRAFADVVWFAERPMMRTAPAPLLSLSGLVRSNGTKVVLTGEGADEVFVGYNIFREDKARRFWARSPDSAWRPMLLSSLYAYVERDSRAEAFWRLFFRKGLENTPDPYYSHRVRWQNTSQMKALFAPHIREAMQTDEELISDLEHYLDPGRGRWHPLCRAQYLEMSLFLPNYLLSSQGDRMMMANSVEGRVPFLDHRVIELAARIPPKYKLRGMSEKYVLKKAFDDLLPPAIGQRPKQPYRAPIATCLPGKDNLAGLLLQKDEVANAGMVSTTAAQRLLHRVGNRTMSERDEMALATVASLQLLHHLFVSKSGRGGFKVSA